MYYGQDADGSHRISSVRAKCYLSVYIGTDQDSPEGDISLATRAIILLTYAYRPLRITELQHALAVSDDAETFDGDGVVAEEVIVSVCCGLIVVDEESKIVRLVREYTC